MEATREAGVRRPWSDSNGTDPVVKLTMVLPCFEQGDYYATDATQHVCKRMSESREGNAQGAITLCTRS